MPLGVDVGLGPDHIVLDGTQLHPKGHSPLPNFGPCLLCPNGWMDEDATWYEGRPRPKPHCVTWGPSSPLSKWAQPSPRSFQSMSIVAKWSPISDTAEHLYQQPSAACINLKQQICGYHLIYNRCSFCACAYLPAALRKAQCAGI